jgi:Tat protein secretion system quality control protein TatD with DNase activity
MRITKEVLLVSAVLLSTVFLATPTQSADEPARKSTDNAAVARLPIFDAHIHYAHNAFDIVPAPQLIEHMRKAGLSRALVSGAMAPGSLDDGAQKLFALAPDLIIPSLRPYRKLEDLQTWYKDPEVLRELEARLKKYRYAAIGEFHLYGDGADTPIVRRIVQLAKQYNLLLHAHSDRDAIERLIKHDPQVRILWAHGGFTTPEIIAEMLSKNKNLWSDLAYRTDMGSNGQVNPEWLELIQRFPDRFMVGTDTFTPERLLYIADHAQYSRGWLSALPKDLAERVAFKNGDALLSLVWKRP